MKKYLSTAVVACAVLVVLSCTGGEYTSPFPDPDAVELLRTTRTFQCDFGDEFSSSITLDDVDYEAGSARLVGNVGTSEAMAVLGTEGASFIEITPVGAVNVLTVYPWRKVNDGTPQPFVAVYSRHTAVAGPSPSQFHGTCRAL